MKLSGILLTLPTGKCLLQLPTEQITPVESVVRNIRLEATSKAIAANGAGRPSLAEEWINISAFAKCVARAFKMERLRREKAAVTVELKREMGFKEKRLPSPVERYLGLTSFTAPSADDQHCVVEASQLSFAPWIEIGDLISVDFTATALSYDGLYLVAVHGSHIAIRGFRQPTRNNWLLYETLEKPPVPLRMNGKLMPADFEIVGRILDIYKKQPTDKKACAARRST